MLYSRKRQLLFSACFTIVWLLSLFTIFGNTPVLAVGNIHYVDASASAPGTGANWANAYPSLQDALDMAVAGDEIWVAAGVYKPTKQTIITDTESATFQLVEGVEIYGGFVGNEMDKSARDWEVNQTILSGDLDGNDTNVNTNNGITLKHAFIVGKNAYTVVSGNSTLTYTNATVLDGFIVTGGRAIIPKIDGVRPPGYPEPDGAGIRFRDNASPTLRNLWVVGNRSDDDGGGIHFHDYSDPILENVTVESAQAGDFTGGIYFERNNNPTFSDVTVLETVGRYSSGIYLHDNNTATFANLNVCGNFTTASNSNSGGNAGTGLSFASDNTIVVMNAAFAANTAGENGGGIRMKGGNVVELHNISVSGNQATSGGGIYIRDTGNVVTITNSIVWGNSSDLVLNEPATLHVSHSLIGDSGTPYTGTGNIASAISPFIQDPEDGVDNTWGTEDDECGDLRLKVAASAVNTGDNGSLPADTLDINGNENSTETLPIDLDGEFRVYSGTVDLGAYEISVAPTPQTITFTLAPEAQSGLEIGESTTLTGTASSGLAVSFSTSTPSVCSVAGSTATMLSSGSCSVVASQTGNGVYAPAPNVSRLISVASSKMTQTITISDPSAGSSVQIGDQQLLSATSSSGLSVVFSSTTPGICTVSGATATMLSQGSCTVAANQSGNESYDPAPQITVSINSIKRDQTIDFTQPALGATALVGDVLPLVAVSDSGLTVTFGSNSPGICSVSGGFATLLAEGSCELIASQAGNGSYNAADDVSRLVSVGIAGKQSQTITFNSPSDTSEAEVNDVLNLSATASSGLVVTFMSNTTSVCTVSGTIAVMKGFGACEIIASQAGNDVYNPAAGVVNTVFVKRPQSINFPTPPTTVNAQSGETIVLTATATSDLSVNFISLTPSVCQITGDSATLVGPGLCQIRASQLGDDSWLPADVATITFNVAGNFVIFLPIVVR